MRAFGKPKTSKSSVRSFKIMVLRGSEKYQKKEQKWVPKWTPKVLNALRDTAAPKEIGG